MRREKVLVVGLGEVGLPLFELLMENKKFSAYGIDVDQAKMRQARQDERRLPEKVDVMHICIQYTDQNRFVDTVSNYAKRFQPKLVIINSTVPPGTTMKVHKSCSDFLVAHSPVRGVHKSLDHMKFELKRWAKYVGGADSKSNEAARKHFEKLDLKPKVLKSCVESELAKVFETTYRAWMIVCFQEMHRISQCVGADFDDVVDFIEDTHRVRFDRPVMFPGVIAGHCLIPNTELLLSVYDSKLLELILESNEKRKKDVKSKGVRDEMKKIKIRVVRLEKQLIGKTLQT